MTLGFSLALTFGAGLYADSGPSIVRQRCELAWGKTEVGVCNQTGWDLTREKAWQHQIDWTFLYAGQQVWRYGLPLESHLQCRYGDVRQHRLNQIAAYGDRPVLRCKQHWPYQDLETIRKRQVLPFWLTERLKVKHQIEYAINTTNPVKSHCKTGWSLLDDRRFQAVSNTPELVWHDKTIPIIQATLSCDEDSPFWIADIELAELTDFAAMAITDEISLTLGLETFVLVIDGKTLSREGLAQQSCRITAVSPLALLDAPFAGTTRFYQTDAISARTAVEQLIGPVDWPLPDWIIPAGKLLLENVTPLAAARTIVAAIGGLLESQPDGAVICRHRHPVSVPDYAAATVAHSLFDHEVITSRTQITPAKGFDRVTIANEESAASTTTADKIEYVIDETNSHQGLVRAYLTTHRPVMLTHTGHPDTVITELGPIVRTETEIVEFVDGRASCKYPVTTITSVTWQHSDLGMVTASQQTLSVDNSGYSLLKLTYTTTSLNWQVSLINDEEVQFILVDL